MYGGGQGVEGALFIQMCVCVCVWWQGAVTGLIWSGRAGRGAGGHHAIAYTPLHMHLPPSPPFSCLYSSLHALLATGSVTSFVYPLYWKGPGVQRFNLGLKLLSSDVDQVELAGSLVVGGLKR